MDVVIIGAGAVGSLLGGLLRVEGHAVSLVGRRGAIEPRALRVVLPSGWQTASGFTAPAQRNPDLTMVALGRHHLAAVRRGGLALPPEAAHTVFWNVDPAQPVRLGLAGDRWSPGVTLLSAVRLQACDVSLASERPVLVVERRSGAAKALGGLRRRGFTVTEVEDAVPFLDALFVYRLLELPAAMCAATIPYFLSFPEGRELAAAVLGEGLKTMERMGRTLARLPVMDPRDLQERIGRRPQAFDRARDLPDQSWPPILQAFLTGRQHEAREITKRIVEMASDGGLSLTWNWRLFQKAGRVASVGFFRDPAELARVLA
jgi:ketopantoate reductase